MEDRTPFEAIKTQFGFLEANVILDGYFVSKAIGRLPYAKLSI